MSTEVALLSSLKTSSPVVSAAISADVICDGGSINLTGSYSDNVTYTDVATPSVTATVSFQVWGL